MIRVTRLTDYAVLVLAEMIRAKGPHTVPHIATSTGLPLPTVAKLLKLLARNGLVTSYRGAAGGYTLQHPAPTITVADVIEAVEGPIAITACMEDSDDFCRIESLCPMQGHWGHINRAIRRALQEITLTDIATAKSMQAQLSENKRLWKTGQR